MGFLQAANIELIIYGLVGLIILGIILKLFKWPLKLLVNGIFGVILLYIVNFVGAYFNFYININIINALIAGIFGIPGVAVLIVFKLFL